MKKTFIIILSLFVCFNTLASGAGLVSLSEDGVGLYIAGIGAGPILSLSNSGIHVNSSSDDAVYVIGSHTEIEAKYLDIVGNIGRGLEDGIFYQDAVAPINTGVNPISDPLASLPEPFQFSISPTAPVDNSKLNINDGVHILQPGYYPGGIDITGGYITLSPGIYQIGSTGAYNEGLSIRGNANVYADQVMLHLLDGGLDVNSSGEVVFTPLSDGLYEGISIFQSRTNNIDSEFNTTGDIDITGSLYFPENNLVFGGTGNVTIGSQVIADSVEIRGAGSLNILYTEPIPEPCTLLLLSIGTIAVRMKHRRQ